MAETAGCSQQYPESVSPQGGSATCTAAWCIHGFSGKDLFHLLDAPKRPGSRNFFLSRVRFRQRHNSGPDSWPVDAFRSFPVRTCHADEGRLPDAPLASAVDAQAPQEAMSNRDEWEDFASTGAVKGARGCDAHRRCEGTRQHPRCNSKLALCSRRDHGCQ